MVMSGGLLWAAAMVERAMNAAAKRVRGLLCIGTSYAVGWGGGNRGSWRSFGRLRNGS